MSDQLKSVARLIGNSYAHLQHGIDRAIEWGFAKMEEQAKVAPPVRRNSKSEGGKKKKAKGIAGNTAAFARGFFSVLGEAGGAYFRTYRRLKKGE